MKIERDGTLKVEKQCLIHLKCMMGNNVHVFLRSGDLRHVKSEGRLKSSTKIKFIDGDYHDGWYTTRSEDKYGLKAKS